MPQRLLVGIDDTDDAQGPGTGRRARELGGILCERSLGSSLGVTRHQLLVDKRIPFTSHNSALCLALDATGTIAEIAAVGREFLSRGCAAGSDPGLCVVRQGDVDGSMIEFGRSAQREVIHKTEALRLAADLGVLLEELGGSGDGVIGSLAAVGLRASGQDGRFVELPGIRELHQDSLRASEILARTAVAAIVDEGDRPVPLNDLVHFGGWLRPKLRDGVPVLLVRRCADDVSLEQGGHGHAGQKGWVTVEHKHKSAR